MDLIDTLDFRLNIEISSVSSAFLFLHECKECKIAKETRGLEECSNS